MQSVRRPEPAVILLLADPGGHRVGRLRGEVVTSVDNCTALSRRS